MLCQQCGALINDDAEICDNCGYRLDSCEQEDISVKDAYEKDAGGEKVPALRTIEEEFSENPKKVDANRLVKILSAAGAVLCFVLFFIAGNVVGSVNVSTPSQSFMSGFFSASSPMLPTEFYISLRYGFFGFGTALSVMLLIQGFKKN